MSAYLVGQSLTLTVTVVDAETKAPLDPEEFLFALKTPLTPTRNTYAWDGTTWTSSESTLGEPSKGGVGVFQLAIEIPFENAHAGYWSVAWHSQITPGLPGRGSGQVVFEVTKAEALKEDEP